MPQNIFSTRRGYHGDLERLQRLQSCEFPILKSHLIFDLRATYDSFDRFMERMQRYKLMEKTKDGYILTNKGQKMVDMLNE